jgi:hypothetical protein
VEAHLLGLAVANGLDGVTIQDADDFTDSEQTKGTVERSLLRKGFIPPGPAFSGAPLWTREICMQG